MNQKNFVLILSLLAAALGGTAQAQIVVMNNNDSGAGSLRDALTGASSGTTITFATNLSGQTITLASQLLVTTNLTVDASTLPGGLTISGNHNSGIFYIQANATVTLNSLTLINGYVAGTNATNIANQKGGQGGDGDGGGIYNAGTLTLNQITLANCSAIGGHGGNDGDQNGTGGTGGDGNGGGIYNAGTLTLYQTTVTRCSAIGGQGGTSGAVQSATGGGGSGGGIYNEGALALYQTVLTLNSAIGGQGGSGSWAGGSGESDGGGIFNAYSGNLIVNQSTLSANAANGGIPGVGGYGPPGGVPGGTARGGGILTYQDVTLNESTLSGNSANGGQGSDSRFGGFAMGGGICNQTAVLNVNQCTLSGNSANGGQGSYGIGGGIENGFVSYLNQSTVSGNSATGYIPNTSDGGIYSHSGSSTSYLFNSIVAGNNPDTTYYMRFSLSGGNLTNGNPMLAPLGNYGGPTQTMPPLSGSPAIDAGSDSATNSPYNFTTDQRGLPRLSGLSVDIGAVEGQVTVASVPARITGAAVHSDGTFGFGFTNLTGASFNVLASTNLSLPLNAWSDLGLAVETPPGSGQFQFTDQQATNHPRRYYRIRSP